MATSNANTASGKSKRPKLTEEERKERQRQYYKANKKKIQKKQREYREANKGRIANVKRKHYLANKEEILEHNRLWAENNKHWRTAYNRKYWTNNKGKLRETTRIYRRDRRNTDNVFRMHKSLRGRLWMALKGKYKSGSAVRDMGCTGQQACDHLESLFDEHMTWDNWGTYWHVDHIYPLAAADLEDRVEFLAVVNWRNLQPLTVPDNLTKGDTVTPEAQELFDSLKEEFRESESAPKEGVA